jgi:1-acyl-sn-glycerol-3-phosphate acyltransferase
MAFELVTKDKKFAPLFWTQFFGALNDNFFKNALVMLITFKAVKLFGLEASLLVPLAGGVFIFPFFLFSATAGQIADKYEKGKIIRITKLTEFAIMCGASLGLYLDNYFLLLIVLFCMGTQSSFFGPLKYGIIPSLVRPDNLVKGNAFVSSGTFIAILLGTICGGLFVEFDNYVSAVSIGLLSLSLIGIVASWPIVNIPSTAKNMKVDYSFFRPTWQILKLTTKNTSIFHTVLGISWFWFLGAAILSLLPVFVKEVLQGNSQVATLFLAIFTIGMGIGCAITEKVSFDRVEIGIVPLSALGMSLFLVDLFWVGANWQYHNLDLININTFLQQSGSWHAMFDLLMISIFGGGYTVPLMSYLQEQADPAEVSRTIAGNNIWNALFMVTAAVVVMLLSPLGTPKTFLILAGLNLVAAFWLYFLHSEYTIRFLFWLLGHFMYDVKIVGKENLPKKGPYILASNHVSFVDWVLIMLAIGRPVRFVIDWNFYYMPMGPFWFRQAKLVPIATKKESQEVLDKAFSQIGKHLNDGAVLGIFPEGWITRDGSLRRFQPGINKVLAKNPVPVVLCGLDGLWGSVFSFEGGRVIFKMPKSLRRKVTISFSKPIDSKEYDAREAEKKMRGMVSHYEDLEVMDHIKEIENGLS